MFLFLTGQYSYITSERTSGMSLYNRQPVFLPVLCLLFEHFYVCIVLVEINTLLNITNSHDESERGKKPKTPKQNQTVVQRLRNLGYNSSCSL